MKPNITAYMEWLQSHPNYQLQATTYAELWEWSTQHIEQFWTSIWEYFDIISHQPYQRVLSGQMPSARWFEGATLNYAEHIFRKASSNRPAILFCAENTPVQSISWEELEVAVCKVANWLRSVGVEKGDRVVGYLPNIPEATIAFLATASLGAIWSSASPDFGASSVLERFGQIHPKALLAVNGYQYGGKVFDKMEVVQELQSQMPSLKGTLLIEYVPNVPIPTTFSNWAEVMQRTATTPLSFTPVPFSHPLWVLYSSGTTGAPKAIIHGHGGMLLEHLKYGTFHNDVHPGERFFWFTTTGWMMWNYLNAMLLSGATIVLYDGSPGYPDMNRLWQLAADLKIQHFGVSAAFILASMKAEVVPKRLDLSSLRSIGSTGSPLPPEGFTWIYEEVKPDVWLTSMSGGTDVCTAFVGGNPLLPVVVGEIQCRALGCAMDSFDENGHSLLNEVGEMVVTQPMPCMPVGFWNDPDGAKYSASYFEDYPGIWRHGDWLRITPNGSLVIYGRSDATLNRQGIRIGTSEIYRSVEKLPEIKDSLIINLEREGGDSFMPLFVTLKEGFQLDDNLQKRIAAQLRADYSPRHVPDVILQVPDIPYTISGKKLELPVKKLLMGKSLDTSVNMGSVRNPSAFDYFIALQQKGF
jgi:acetoacetyl-CoA synthetase